MWVGAEVSSARGGRRAHAPELKQHFPRMNKKEIQLAMQSAFASTASPKFITSRYSSLSNTAHIPIPAVLDSLPSKTKALKQMLEKIYGNLDLIFKNKVQRTGLGKRRSRRYKSNAGALIITSDNEKVKLKGLDIKKLSNVEISDLYPLGRITLYTKKALDELSKDKKESKK
jgi:ribosomal protein L4